MSSELPRGAGLASATPRKDTHDGNGQPRLRDRLLLLIRQHHLDAEQVKRYAANFCGTSALREASREQVEKLVDHLTTLAAQGREALRGEQAVHELTCPKCRSPVTIDDPTDLPAVGCPSCHRQFRVVFDRSTSLFRLQPEGSGALA